MKQQKFELPHQSEGVLSLNARLLKVFAVRQTFFANTFAEVRNNLFKC